MSGKLTKKFLMILPQGVYLASNCCSSETGLPVFLEKVEDHQTREKQWEKIKEVSANDRYCHVSETKEGLSWMVEGMQDNKSNIGNRLKNL